MTKIETHYDEQSGKTTLSVTAGDLLERIEKGEMMYVQFTIGGIDAIGLLSNATDDPNYMFAFGGQTFACDEATDYPEMQGGE